MTKEDCYQLGKITKTHGIQGELVFFLDVDEPQVYEALDSVLLEIKGDLVPYFIESIVINRNRAIVALEGVDTIGQAQLLVNTDLYLPLDNLEPLTGNQFYYHEIVGFRVHDEQAGELGTVRGIYSLSTQDLIAMDYQDVEVLIPITDDIVLSMGREQNVLTVRLPEGLLDLYLSEKSASISLEADDVEGDEN